MTYWAVLAKTNFTPNNYTNTRAPSKVNNDWPPAHVAGKFSTNKQGQEFILWILIQQDMHNKIFTTSQDLQFFQENGRL